MKAHFGLIEKWRDDFWEISFVPYIVICSSWFIELRVVDNNGNYVHITYKIRFITGILS